MAFSACQLCNFSGALTIYHVKKPLKMSQSFCVSACIWANLWVLLSPQSETGPSSLPLGWRWWAQLLLHHHAIRHFGSIHTFRIPTTHRALCSLAIKRAKEEFHQVCNVSAFVLTGVLFQFLSGCFSRRHCCRSSWRWREEEVPTVCHCCPGLFEYGALGRGHWPTAAHPHGPPCDKPGNVEWRPVKGKGGRKRSDSLFLDLLSCRSADTIFFHRFCMNFDLLLCPATLQTVSLFQRL